MSSNSVVDVVLVGGGIMSATLATLLKELQPDWEIRIYERLGSVAQESSNPWNNAGTGHSALCELNYMPDTPERGPLDPAKAIGINEQFQVSRQWWSHLVADGVLPEPSTFINSTPHMTFVHGADDVDYLRRRFEALKDEPLFEGLEYTEDPAVIARWTPLLVHGRAKGEPIAATRSAAGTDVDFGSLTRQLIDHVTEAGATFAPHHEVRGIRRRAGGGWTLKLHQDVGGTSLDVDARFVFVGAGGGALHLLQSSGIPEVRGFGGFPISGEFLRCDVPEIVRHHSAKVYGKAAVGAPPMSVPHLDTRVVDGVPSLLFGPYAGFSPKFLKNGSVLDLPLSVRAHNLAPMLQVAGANGDLMSYLVGELLASRSKKMEALRAFMPTAKDEDWDLITAGQRVQVMKKGPDGRGTLQFGTEVITSADGSIAGLLGASPGASTAVPIMLQILRTCFGERMTGWEPKLRGMIPTYGESLNERAGLAAETLARTADTLGLAA